MSEFVQDYGDLSETAIENESKLGFSVVPQAEVYVDSEFNSRGTFTAASVIELSRDITERGLIAPLILRRLWDSETKLKAKGFKYFLVAGFRRFKAYQCCRTNYVLASIRDVKDEFEACDINAIENLQRSELTFYQEARSIKHYWAQDIPRADVARRINKSSGWVQLRFDLLNMQPEIQTLANQGYILPHDMKDLRKVTGDVRMQLAGRLADARRDGKSPTKIKAQVKHKEKATTRKIRSETEVSDLMETIRLMHLKIPEDRVHDQSCFVSPEGKILAHRLFAWSFGHIDSLTMHTSLKNYFFGLGVRYDIPDFTPEMLPSVFR